MTELIKDDVTGQVLDKDSSYRVQIYSRGNNIHKDLDCGLGSIETILAATVKIPWFKLSKNESTGKWERVPLPQE